MGDIIVIYYCLYFSYFCLNFVLFFNILVIVVNEVFIVIDIISVKVFFWFIIIVSGVICNYMFSFSVFFFKRKLIIDVF